MYLPKRWIELNLKRTKDLVSVCVCVCVCISHSVVSNSLGLHRP